MKKIDVVAAVISDNQNKILCAQKAAHDKDPFRWEFPGGKVEENESYTLALKREIKEELNLAIEVRSLITETVHISEQRTIFLKVFSANVISGQLSENVHSQVKWVGIDELNDMDWLDADKKIIGEVIEYQNGNK
jgi:8-oxo-dGTP diphosphatase